MNKEQLIQEKEMLEYRLQKINEALNIIEKRTDATTFKLDVSPWEKDILWQIADIIRTSPIVNKNYPHGYDCDICKECGNECTTDGDGIDCNWAFMEYFEKELKDRGFFG